MLRILEQYSPQSPYLDNIRGHQEWAELDKVRDWAKGMEKCGHSISRIRINLDECGKPDDPPDVLADMDGRPVGIEVTDLVEYPKKHAIWFAAPDRRATILTWKQRQNGTFDFRCMVLSSTRTKRPSGNGRSKQTQTGTRTGSIGRLSGFRCGWRRSSGLRTRRPEPRRRGGCGSMVRTHSTLGCTAAFC